MNGDPNAIAEHRAIQWRRWATLGLIGVALATQSLLASSKWRGVVVSTSGETLTYRASAWLLAIFGVLIGVMLLLGLLLVTIRFFPARLLGVIVLLATLAVAFAIPATLMSARLVVTPEGFDHTVGFWWKPERQTARFDSLVAIRVVPEPTSDGSPTFSLVCRGRDGESVKMPLSDNLKAALREIKIRALRRGVILRDDEAEMPGPVIFDDQ